GEDAAHKSEGGVDATEVGELAGQEKRKGAEPGLAEGGGEGAGEVEEGVYRAPQGTGVRSYRVKRTPSEIVQDLLRGEGETGSIDEEEKQGEKGGRTEAAEGQERGEGQGTEEKE
ncbi:unnamed protein product, partial [Discosporangium mesarthrocarpum]